MLSVSGIRNLFDRETTVAFIFGILIGFTMAGIFFTNPTKSYWLYYYSFEENLKIDLRDDFVDGERSVQDVATLENAHVLENRTLTKQLYKLLKS